MKAGTRSPAGAGRAGNFLNFVVRSEAPQAHRKSTEEGELKLGWFGGLRTAGARWGEPRAEGKSSKLKESSAQAVQGFAPGGTAVERLLLGKTKTKKSPD